MTLNPWHLALSIACLLSVLGVPPLKAQQAKGEFPPGRLTRLEELPVSRVRTQLERLPPTAQQRGLQWLRSFHFTELDLRTLHADRKGGIFYVCEAIPQP